jgi:DNA-binding HxlR family transcriptional regulator
MEVRMKAVRQADLLSFVPICGSKDPIAVRELLTKVGDKWSICVVLSLARLPGTRARFSELERSIPGISQRMLTLTLRNLERDGLLIRELFAEVPLRVEYELTSLGKSLLSPMQGLVDWVEDNWKYVKVARAKFDAKPTATPVN